MELLRSVWHLLHCPLQKQWRLPLRHFPPPPLYPSQHAYDYTLWQLQLENYAYPETF